MNWEGRSPCWTVAHNIADLFISRRAKRFVQLRTVISNTFRSLDGGARVVTDDDLIPLSRCRQPLTESAAAVDRHKYIRSPPIVCSQPRAKSYASRACEVVTNRLLS